MARGASQQAPAYLMISWCGLGSPSITGFPSILKLRDLLVKLDLTLGLFGDFKVLVVKTCEVDQGLPGFEALQCSWFCPSFTRSSILSMLIYGNPISDILLI
ncbi:hypothetical protein Tco_0353569 [Tanacetum coccineum]